MKYILTVLVTAIIVFLAATIYYNGLPKVFFPQSASDISTEMVETPIATPTTSPQDTSLSVIIKDALVQKYGSASADMVVTVSKIQGDYAQGMVTEQGGGGIWFATKINDIWNLVWDGNGIVTCNITDTYPDFPTDIIPECFATASGKLIRR